MVNSAAALPRSLNGSRRQARKHVFGAILIAALILLWAVWVAIDRRRRRFRREEHVRNHAALSDADFLAELGVDEKGRAAMCVAVRNALADHAAIPADKIHPSDCMWDLFFGISDSALPFSDMHAAINEAAGVELNERLVWAEELEGDSPWDAETLADMLRFYISNWDKLIQPTSDA